MKKMNLVPNKQLLPNVPFQSTKYKRKNYVWTTKYKSLLEMCIVQHVKMKNVYISTNETTSFYDCKKGKTSCYAFNIPFEDQRPTIMLFGGAGKHCFARKTSRDYEKEEPSPYLRTLLRQ